MKVPMIGLIVYRILCFGIVKIFIQGYIIYNVSFHLYFEVDKGSI